MRKNNETQIIKAVTMKGDIQEYEIVLGYNPNNKLTPYVTWICFNKNDYNFGHYFKTKSEAYRDFFNRINEEIKYIIIR
jgi:hypothetical protein